MSAIPLVESPAVDAGSTRIAAELRRFLELGAAQLDAAMREADARVAQLAAAVTGVATDARAIAEQAGQLESKDADQVEAAQARIRELAVALTEHVGAAVMSLQFYDKLIQRLTHVRDGLAIPSDSTAEPGQGANSDWNAMLEQVRSRYSMVEERVLFDFMIRGLSADQMLKALTGLRAAASPGELEVF